MRIFPKITFVFLLFTACSSTGINQNSYVKDQLSGQDINVVHVSEVKWQQLNPKRGDKSPKAANLWGERLVPGPSGFLVEFTDGFSSPPHIHNFSYRGVVIRGLIHNDDPAAAVMWLPVGSFWTQPAGEVHITSCKGGCLAYIEIDDGPFLVHPAGDAFDNGERPVNIDKSNLVWLNSSDLPPSSGAEVAYLWGSPKKGQPNGTMLKLPPGFEGNIGNKNSSLQVVVIQGQLSNSLPGEKNENSISPGSYLDLPGSAGNNILCRSEEDCIVYVRSKTY